MLSPLSSSVLGGSTEKFQGNDFTSFPSILETSLTHLVASERTESFDVGKNAPVAGQTVIASDKNEAYKFTTATPFCCSDQSFYPLPTISILQQSFILQQ